MTSSSTLALLQRGSQRGETHGADSPRRWRRYTMRPLVRRITAAGVPGDSEEHATSVCPRTRDYSILAFFGELVNRAEDVSQGFFGVFLCHPLALPGAGTYTGLCCLASRSRSGISDLASMRKPIVTVGMSGNNSVTSSWHEGTSTMTSTAPLSPRTAA